ncbi:MAG TPA: sensor histidine kinase [Gemmatimonadaceae bacterium]|nr:sensor histidine kinase [Gemmatimonadaceae bacterium]
MVQLPQSSLAELDAAILQIAVTLGICVYSALLYRRYRKPWFLWFAVAWLLYVLRLGAIVAFLLTARFAWLYWHQVVTGWTALALLWAALVFSRQLVFRPAYLLALLFPLGWSFVAIYVLDNFLFAALPAVLFLSAVTAWTGWIFYDFWRRVRAPGAGVLAAALLLWAVHHLDYPFLRARGAWAPWGYYLDIMLLLATATGITLLVLDDLRRGIQSLAALATGASGSRTVDVIESLLGRAAGLPAARGAALYHLEGRTPRVLHAVGVCTTWTGTPTAPAAAERLVSAIDSRRPEVLPDWPAPDGRRHAFTAILPIVGELTAPHALVVVGDTRDPFAALDHSFLVALGGQLGAALDGAELTQRLRDRTGELTRLSARMLQQHESERKRLSRELHDETAQVFSALKLQLGLLRERVDASVPGSSAGEDLEQALDLVDEGMRSIRSVTETLRPAVLDELGLIPALRSIIEDFASRYQVAVDVQMAASVPRLAPDVELALYRALQESLTNVMRHAGAGRVRVVLDAADDTVSLRVEDDGAGLPAHASLATFEREGRMGLAGMRDRVSALGGSLVLAPGRAGGTRVDVRMPAPGGRS